MNHPTKFRIWAAGILLCFGISFCNPAVAQHLMKGKATYYADYMHGKRCADGSVYNKNGFTCAHRTLPFGTVIKVTNLNNGLSTTVTVTDRGPFGKGLVIDLTRAAAQEIKMIASGVVPVTLEVVKGKHLHGNEALHDFLDEQIDSISSKEEYLRMFELEPEILEPHWMDLPEGKGK